MTRRRRIPGLLAVALGVLGAAPDRSLATDSPDTSRLQTVSSGPRGLPPRRDPAVEPASFQPPTRRKALPATEPSTPARTAKPPVLLDPPTSRAGASDDPEPGKPLTTVKRGRRLSTPDSSDAVIARRRKAPPSAGPLDSLLAWRPSSQTMTATGGALAVAVGLVLACTWLVRSCLPKSARALPSDVVEVLGRAPLGGKQTTQLVRVGPKLVLVALTPEGAETLTEITDPREVAEVVAACRAGGGDGAAAEFDQLLQQMSHEPTLSGFLGGDSDRETRSYGFADAGFDPRSLAAAYANTPGGRGDG